MGESSMRPCLCVRAPNTLAHSGDAAVTCKGPFRSLDGQDGASMCPLHGSRGQESVRCCGARGSSCSPVWHTTWCQHAGCFQLDVHVESLTTY
jgi:hypothetical protein